MAERRQARVAHLVQAALGRLLLEEARDARLRTVTVSAVRMSPDLRVARVYVRSLDPIPDRAATLAALDHATPFLRREVGRGLGLRATPELRFAYDDLPDTARRLDELLAEPEEEDPA